MDLPDLTARAHRLARTGRRRVLGIAGPPGAGKSTLAARITDALGPLAALVPMDGFHLAGAELERLGRAGRKGAPDTFDAAGYAALLRRLRAPEPGTVVYAPAFDRSLEEPVAGAIPVPPDVPLVVTEGNYLLYGEGPWAPVRGLLDEAWYPGPFVWIMLGSRGVARASAALSSVANAPRCRPPPPCSHTHHAPLPDPA